MISPKIIGHGLTDQERGVIIMANTVKDIDSTTLRAIAHVGRTATYRSAQYVIHSVEGADWYAFDQGDNLTTVDFGMTRASWIREPIAMILPAGCKIGDGWAIEVPLSAVQLGVCLVKAYR